MTTNNKTVSNFATDASMKLKGPTYCPKGRVFIVTLIERVKLIIAQCSGFQYGCMQCVLDLGMSKCSENFRQAILII